MPIFLLNGTKIPQFEQFHAPLSKNNRVLLLNGSIHPLIDIPRKIIRNVISHHKMPGPSIHLNSLYMHPTGIVPQACQMERQRMECRSFVPLIEGCSQLFATTHAYK